ncbi:MAG: HAD family phosphatase [Spirochaetaceae bacterium]|jgi:16S rRNA pseudouridine516 synthase|nr:HAD family phosphatase [Spirochaetaceae bacterium]
MNAPVKAPWESVAAAIRAAGCTAAIFDLDGTLTDSMGVWDRVCSRYLESLGITGRTDMDDAVADRTLTQGAEYVRRYFGLAATVPEIIGAWEALVIHQYKNDVPLKAGMGDLVADIAGSGMAVALATSSFPAAAEAVLTRWNVRRFFQALVYSDEVGRDKTHPDIYLKAAERLGVPPENCVVFEDLPASIQGVRKAGMRLCAVHDPFHQGWEAFAAAADFVMSNQ